MSDIKQFRLTNGQPTELQGNAADLEKPLQTADRAINVMTIKFSRGREFPVGPLPGVAHMLTKGEDEQEAAWVFYLTATRATQRLGMMGWEKMREPVRTYLV